MTDVGGGSVSNDVRHNLARIPLRWMIRQCFLTNTGIRFHAELLRTVGLDPTSLFPIVKPRPPPVSSSPYVRRSGPTKFTGSNHSRPDHDRDTTLVEGLPVPVLPKRAASEGSGMVLGGKPVPIKPGLGYACRHHEDMHMTEEEEDLADALCPIFDQLSLKPSWWILEVVPMKHRVQRDDNSWWQGLTYVYPFCYMLIGM